MHYCRLQHRLRQHHHEQHFPSCKLGKYSKTRQSLWHPFRLTLGLLCYAALRRRRPDVKSSCVCWSAVLRTAPWFCDVIIFTISDLRPAIRSVFLQKPLEAAGDNSAKDEFTYLHNKAKVWFDDSKPQSHGKSESHGKRSWSAGVPEVAHSRSANRRQVTSRTCSSHFLRPTGMKSWSLRFLLHLSKRHLEDLERPFLAPFQYDVHSLGREGRPGHSKQRHCDHDHVDSA